VQPIKDFWLDRLHILIEKQPHLLMMGSNFKGAPWLEPMITCSDVGSSKAKEIECQVKVANLDIWSWLHHINGNALYGNNKEMRNLVTQARLLSKYPIYLPKYE